MENGPGGEPGGQPIPGGSRPPPTTPGLFGPPRLRIGGDEEDRHASWLEAFFDLVFVAPPGRYLLWAVGLAVDFATPLSAGGLHARFAPSSSHLPERFGLFTLIVLGETIGAVVVELATHPWSRLAVLTAFSGLILAFAFWWVYFDNLDDAVIRASRERGRIWIYQGWLYAHLPFYAAIAATGVGVDYAIRADQYIPLPDPQRWLVAGSAAVCFATLGAIHYAKARAGSTLCTLPRARVRWGGAAVALAIAALGWLLHPLGVLALLAAVGVLEVVWEMALEQGMGRTGV